MLSIIGINRVMEIENKLENVNENLVEYKEIHRRNGMVRKDVRVHNGKRDIVFSSGVYDEIIVQDENGNIVKNIKR